MFIMLTDEYGRKIMVAIDSIVVTESYVDATRISIKDGYKSRNGSAYTFVKEDVETIYAMVTEAQNRQQVKNGKDAE